MQTTFALALGVLLAVTASATAEDTRLYELRVYYAAEGKLDALHARFRDHTTKLFEKHGITNIGYWVPIENPDNKLIYVVSFPDREARNAAWKAFSADPEWQRVYKESHADGKLVDRVESTFLTATDYSPTIKPLEDEAGVFELRTYTASEGNLGALNARFREHTMKLFEKHGMTNVAYWNLVEGQEGADNTLIYILAHKDAESRNQSFAAFREDPAWLAARTASEEKAGGSLTVPEGVKSVLMKATDYSPIK